MCIYIVVENFLNGFIFVVGQPRSVCYDGKDKNVHL